MGGTLLPGHICPRVGGQVPAVPLNSNITQVEDLTLYDSTPNQSARGLADWVSVTEQYLLQQHPWG